MQAWAELNGISGELQNGFLIGRRLDDNLFVLTQCIEMSNGENKPLYLALLDITGEYDKVNHNILLDIPEEKSIDDDCIQRLREVYRDNTVCVEWAGMSSKEKIYISKGRVEAGVSSIAAVIHDLHVRTERALERSNIGFNLSYKQTGLMKEQQLPGLFYADNIVLLAEKQAGIRLADICGQQGEALRFRFSVTKCGLMTSIGNSDQAVLIRDQEIPRVREYKYLGIWINEG